MRMILRCGLLPLFGLLVTCAPKPRTELVVGLATDLGPSSTDALQEMRLTAWAPYDAEIPAFQRIWNYPGDFPQLPGSISVYAPDGAEQTIRLVLTGRTVTGKTIVRSAITTLAPGKSLFLRLMLLRSCLGMDCRGTCVEGVCRPEWVERSHLPEYVQPPPGLERKLECRSGPDDRPTQVVSTSTGQPYPGSNEACPGGRYCIENTCYGGSLPVCDVDGVKNGEETGVDCGGTACDACPIGSNCGKDWDCGSLACSSGTSRCEAAGHCRNGRLDEGEADTDCGGECAPCKPGRLCRVANDCAAGSECENDRCVQPTCSDGRKNGIEEGVDCGGEPDGGCPPCPPDGGASD